MNIFLQKLALSMALFSATAYAARPEIVSQTKNDITITAQAMSAGECLDTFYKDLYGQHIYPVILSVTNNSDKATVFSCNHTTILNAKVLTPRSIDAQISSLSCTSLFLVITIVLIPLALATENLANRYRELKPIIEKFSSGDTPVTIEPGATFKTIVFIEFEYPKDAEGKTLRYIVPQSLNATIELQSTGWFTFLKGNPNIFELNIPVVTK